MKQLFLAVLFSLLICTTGSATSMVSAEASRTSDAVFRLRDACKAFYVEYGYFPPADAALLLRILQGENAEGHNWRRIVFWEPRLARTKWIFWTIPGDFDASGRLIDGWLRPFRFESTSDGLLIWSEGPKATDTKEHAIKSMRGVILLPEKTKIRTDQSTESRAFGTSGISAAEQPRMPEASGMR